MSWTRLVISVQITDNIPGYWEQQGEGERDGQTQIKKRTYTRRVSISFRLDCHWLYGIISDSIAQKTDRNFQRKREWETRTKRCTLTHTMSDNIARDYYTHLDTKREKERRIKRRTYTRKMKREKMYSAIIRWVSWKRVFIYMQITDNIHGCWDKQRERERERDKRGSRDVPIHVQSVKIIIAEQ